MANPENGEPSRRGTTAVATLLDALHRPKDRAYGDAWRRRGEVLGIFANIARKVDRLEIAATEGGASSVESSAETVADLAVYVGKYLTWLAERFPHDFEAVLPAADASRCSATQGPDAFDEVLSHVVQWERAAAEDAPVTPEDALVRVRRFFGVLERGLMAQAEGNSDAVLPSSAKISAAWALLSAAIWFLVRLDERDPKSITALWEETKQMSQRNA